MTDIDGPVSPLVEQYSETKEAIDRLAERRENIRDNAYQLIRVFILAVAGLFTLFGFSDRSRMAEMLLSNPICSIQQGPICIRANLLIFVLSLSTLTAVGFVMFSLGGSRMSVRTTNYDISDVLLNDYDSDDFLRGRLVDLRRRSEVAFISTRIMSLSLVLGLLFGLLSVVQLFILSFNIVTESSITKWGIIPVIISVIFILIILRGGLRQFMKKMKEQRDMKNTSPKELIHRDKPSVIDQSEK